MELERPLQLPDKTYRVPVLVAEPYTFDCELKERGSHVTPEGTEAVAALVRDMAAQYEQLSKKWLPLPVLAVTFLGRVSHAWEFGTHQPYYGTAQEVIARQSWRPEWIHVNARTFVVHWTLASISYREDSGEETEVQDGTEEIPLAAGPPAASLVPSQRLRALRKVRAARLQAAVARARAKALVVRYYERYGERELLNGDDVLSSEDELI